MPAAPNDSTPRLRQGILEQTVCRGDIILIDVIENPADGVFQCHAAGLQEQ